MGGAPLSGGGGPSVWEHRTLFLIAMPGSLGSVVCPCEGTGRTTKLYHSSYKYVYSMSYIQTEMLSGHRFERSDHESNSYVNSFHED